MVPFMIKRVKGQERKRFSRVSTELLVCFIITSFLHSYNTQNNMTRLSQIDLEIDMQLGRIRQLSNLTFKNISLQCEFTLTISLQTDLP